MLPSVTTAVLAVSPESISCPTVVVPGSVGLDGMLSVIAPVAADAVIWFAVPAIVVGSAVQDSAAHDVSTPRGKLPAIQFAPFAAPAVASDAVPVSDAMIVPAEKFPDPSRATIVELPAEADAVVFALGRTPET